MISNLYYVRRPCIRNQKALAAALSYCVRLARPSRAVGSPQTRCSGSSSKIWQSRQGRDRFAREAKVQGLKSRAAFKLLEVSWPQSIYEVSQLTDTFQINEKYRIFRPGQTVVDLVFESDLYTRQSCTTNVPKGYAPGSWSQVAVDRTAPDGRVLGIDIIPAQPPKGVSTIQGNFLSAAVRAEVKEFLSHPGRGRPRQQRVLSTAETGDAVTPGQLEVAGMGYLNLKQRADTDDLGTTDVEESSGHPSQKQKEWAEPKMVDVVLSDMSAPWDQTTGFWKRSLSDPYYRMMNTSGMSFRDHAGSMVRVQPSTEDLLLAC